MSHARRLQAVRIVDCVLSDADATRLAAAWVSAAPTLQSINIGLERAATTAAFADSFHQRQLKLHGHGVVLVSDFSVETVPSVCHLLALQMPTLHTLFYRSPVYTVLQSCVDCTCYGGTANSV